MKIKNSAINLELKKNINCPQKVQRYNNTIIKI